MNKSFLGFRGFALIATTILFSVLFSSCDRNSASNIHSVKEQLVERTTELTDLQTKNEKMADTLKTLRKEETKIVKMLGVRAVKVVKRGEIVKNGRYKETNFEIIFFATDSTEYSFKEKDGIYEQYPGVFNKKNIANLNESSQKFARDAKKIESNIENTVIGVQNSKVIYIGIGDRLY